MNVHCLKKFLIFKLDIFMSIFFPTKYPLLSATIVQQPLFCRPTEPELDNLR